MHPEVPNSMRARLCSDFLNVLCGGSRLNAMGQVASSVQDHWHDPLRSGDAYSDGDQMVPAKVRAGRFQRAGSLA
jgi:hypothetical protein